MRANPYGISAYLIEMGQSRKIETAPPNGDKRAFLALWGAEGERFALLWIMESRPTFLESRPTFLESRPTSWELRPAREEKSEVISVH